MIKSIIRKLFFYENYVVGYRFLKNSEEPVGIRNPSYDIINPSGTQWYADPFPFIHNEKHYIFVEMYSIWEQKANLGVFCIEEGGKPRKILSESFHLSYPNVFEWDGDIYMLPETHNAKQLRLYKCIDFPYKWKLEKVLLNNVDYADTSFLFDEKDIWVETMEDKGNRNYANKLFKLDMKEKRIINIKPTHNNWIDKRPAGNFFKVNNEWFHALQECSKAYGEYMHVAKVNVFNEQEFDEKVDRILQVTDYSLNSSIPFIYTHTLNRCSNFEVIDLLYRKFSLIKPLACFWRYCSRIVHKLNPIY